MAKLKITTGENKDNQQKAAVKQALVATEKSLEGVER